jgi:hypothetical protein
MTTETFQIVVQLAIAVFCVGAVPWAIVVERRLAKIDGRLSNGLSERISTNRKQLSDVERRLRNCEIMLAKYNKGSQG